jgi:hypothetical protein
MIGGYKYWINERDGGYSVDTDEGTVMEFNKLEDAEMYCKTRERRVDDDKQYYVNVP